MRGVLAGVLGGLAASWVMNEFSAGPGKKLTKAVQSKDEKDQSEAEPNGREKQDSTMKTADTLATAVTGEHLTQEQQETGGPMVHYAFGAAMGGLYGGLAEYSGAMRSGFGTTFATALFTGADLFAIPALKLSGPPTEQTASSLATPYAAHLVYGVTTELVRRLVRWIV